MRRRILSLLLMSVLIFSIFSTFVGAETETSDLLTEIKTNFPNLKLDSLPGDKPGVIGAIEDLTDESSLYLYVYNPSGNEILSGYLNLSMNLTSSSGSTYKYSYSKLAFSVIDKKTSSGVYNLYYKLRVNLSSRAAELKDHPLKHEYQWDSLTIKYSDLKMNTVNTLTVVQDCFFSFDYTDPENVVIGTEISDVLTLDVNHTFFRTGSTSSKSVVDEIHTVYFSIPDEYLERYETLYSITSSYTKKHTTPQCIITTDTVKKLFPSQSEDFVGPPAPGVDGSFSGVSFEDGIPFFVPSSSFISSDYRIDGYLLSGMWVEQLEADVGYNLKAGLLHDYEINLNLDFPSYWFISSGEDYWIPVERVFEYIEKGLDVTYFDRSEKFKSDVKTVEDSFDSISYANQHDFFDFWDDYGFASALQIAAYKNNPDKLNALLEKLGLLETNYKDYLDQPYLLLCDSGVKDDANKLSAEEFSKKYLININDVPRFKDYLKSNDNVVLYRFDVCEYFSEEVIHGYVKTNGTFVEYSDALSCIVQQYLYFDFKVIDVTFKTEDQFVSVMVNYPPQDLGSDPSLEDTDKPPVNFFPKGDDDGDKDKGPDIWDLLFTAVIAIGSIVLLVYGVRFIVVSFVDIAKSNKKNE